MTRLHARSTRTPKIALFANTDWYLYNFRLSLARMLKASGVEVLLLSPPGPYASRFDQEGLRWLPVPFARRSLEPTEQLRAILRLTRIYARESPDVVHHFTIKCAVYGSIAARLAGVRSVVNALAGLGSTGAKPSGHRHTLARTLAFGSLRIALRRTHVIVQNPDDQAMLTAAGIVSASQCELIRGSGVDIKRFRPTLRVGGPPAFLLASRLLWSKGIREFVEAAAVLRRRYPNARFIVAGAADPGNPDTLLPADLDWLRGHSDIEFLGHVDDMTNVLASVDGVVLPTCYGEGVPRILVEAAACALPLVATDVPGCREIVRHGVNGFLVQPGNPAMLIDAIESLITSPERRDRMGRAARRIAEREFSEEVVLGSTLAAYRRLLEGQPPAQVVPAGI